MSSRLIIPSLPTASSSTQRSDRLPSTRQNSRSHSSRTNVWVDPASLPDAGDISTIGGNAPDYVKQLNQNTFSSYGVGHDDCFGYKVGRAVKFVDVSVDQLHHRRNRLEASTVAELVVNKDMLNGAGMLHGGCISYLIDNCCSTPLVVLGLIQNTNGVGVTQAMNIMFHSPAALGTTLSIVSTSVSLGGRVMSARCEILDKCTGRVVASGSLNKMQPNMAKL